MLNQYKIINLCIKILLVIKNKKFVKIIKKYLMLFVYSVNKKFVCNVVYLIYIMDIKLKNYQFFTINRSNS